MRYDRKRNSHNSSTVVNSNRVLWSVLERRDQGISAAILEYNVRYVLYIRRNYARSYLFT
jgi:hypothetical protein